RDFHVTGVQTCALPISGTFDDYTGPIGGFDEFGNRINGGARIFAEALSSNPVLFPATYPSGDVAGASHPLFGNAQVGGSTTLYKIGRASCRERVYVEGV